MFSYIQPEVALCVPHTATRPFVQCLLLSTALTSLFICAGMIEDSSDNDDEDGNGHGAGGTHP